MLRWKSTAILFAFLTALGFLILQEYFPGDSDIDFGFVVVVFLTSLLLSGIFLLSLFTSEKRILDNQYTVWWLLKFNVFLVLTLYVLGFLALAVLVWSAQSGGEGLGMLIVYAVYFGAWIIPLVVIIFSLLPSVFLYRFCSNKKVLRILLVLFVVLFLVILKAVLPLL